MILALVHLGEFRVLPWLMPGVAISAGIGLAASRWLGRVLGVRRSLAGALIVSLGMVLSATLTPVYRRIDSVAGEVEVLDHVVIAHEVVSTPVAGDAVGHECGAGLDEVQEDPSDLGRIGDHREHLHG